MKKLMIVCLLASGVTLAFADCTALDPGGVWQIQTDAKGAQTSCMLIHPSQAFAAALAAQAAKTAAAVVPKPVTCSVVETKTLVPGVTGQALIATLPNATTAQVNLLKANGYTVNCP